MKKPFVTIVLLFAALGCSSDKDPCTDMQVAIDENALRGCIESSDCESIPCACADGSTVSVSACNNGLCGGLDEDNGGTCP